MEKDYSKTFEWIYNRLHRSGPDGDFISLVAVHEVYKSQCPKPHFNLSDFGRLLWREGFSVFKCGGARGRVTDAAFNSNQQKGKV